MGNKKGIIILEEIHGKDLWGINVYDGIDWRVIVRRLLMELSDLCIFYLMKIGVGVGTKINRKNG